MAMAFSTRSPTTSRREANGSKAQGVTPDVEVRPDRKSLLAGKDAVLDAAVDWIKSQSRKSSP